VFDDQPRQNLFVWVAAALLILALGYRLLSERAPTAAPAVEVSKPRDAGGGERLYVHVAGAVKRPGLYRVPRGARVATAIELARGTRRRADLTTVNLAAKVEDGQQIVVPVRGRAGAPAATAAPSGAGSEAGGQISLASATQAQLEELPGIGPVLAQAILDYRDANGGFSSLQELLEVDGIGEQRFDDLRQAVRP
jgi:competence protein ComEA